VAANREFHGRGFTQDELLSLVRMMDAHLKWLKTITESGAFFMMDDGPVETGLARLNHLSAKAAGMFDRMQAAREGDRG
jgi:hypothetical protein